MDLITKPLEIEAKFVGTYVFNSFLETLVKEKIVIFSKINESGIK